MLQGQRACAGVPLTVQYSYDIAHQNDGARATWVTQTGVVMYLIAASWARA